MENATLVLIHGYPFDHWMWDQVIAALGEATPVFAPDLPGFGGRPVLDADPSLEALADDLAGQLRERGIERAVLAGMSMGGYVALAFAEAHASRVAGLALVSSQSAGDSDEARAGRKAMIEKVAAEGPQVAAEAAIPKLFAERNAGKTDLTAFPRRGAEKAGVAGIQWALKAMAARPDRTDVLRSLKAPVLILHGSEDKFIPVEKARQLAASVPEAEFAELAGAGHATPLEAPAEVASALKVLCGRAARLPVNPA